MSGRAFVALIALVAVLSAGQILLGIPADQAARPVVVLALLLLAWEAADVWRGRRTERLGAGRRRRARTDGGRPWK